MITLYIDNVLFGQTEKYNKYFLANHKNDCEWIAIVDLDEFVYARRGFNTIRDFLMTLKTEVSVAIPWKMFGSNKFIEQPESVIQNFNERSNFYRRMHDKGKQIFRIKHATCITPHEPRISIEDKTILSNGEPFIRIENVWTKYHTDDLEYHSLHLNHYQIQSYNWYRDVKMTRGDADNPKWIPCRNIQTFHAQDFNDEVDLELKTKTYK